MANVRECPNCHKNVWVTTAARLCSHRDTDMKACAGSGVSVIPGHRESSVDQGFIDAIVESEDWSSAKRLDTAGRRALVRSIPEGFSGGEIACLTGFDEGWVKCVRSRAARSG